MSVEVTESIEKDVLILRVDGRLDAASSPLLERKIDAFLETGQTKILMNFENVEYMSSAGMRLLLSVGKKLTAKEGKMALASLTDEVLEVLKMSGMDRLLEIYHTEREALASFV